MPWEHGGLETRGWRQWTPGSQGPGNIGTVQQVYIIVALFPKSVGVFLQFLPHNTVLVCTKHFSRFCFYLLILHLLNHILTSDWPKHSAEVEPFTLTTV